LPETDAKRPLLPVCFSAILLLTGRHDSFDLCWYGLAGDGTLPPSSFSYGESISQGVALPPCAVSHYFRLGQSNAMAIIDDYTAIAAELRGLIAERSTEPPAPPTQPTERSLFGSWHPMRAMMTGETLNRRVGLLQRLRTLWEGYAMAYRRNNCPVKSPRSNDFDFALTFSKPHDPGREELAPTSGIYRCLGCGQEIVLMMGARFSFDSDDGHSVQWQLAVKPESRPNH
jgi:hypothetical protein